MRTDRGFQWLWLQIQVYNCFPNIINVFGMLSASYVVQRFNWIIMLSNREYISVVFPI